MYNCTCTLRYFLYQDVSTEYGCSFDLSEELVACVMSVVDSTDHFISLAIQLSLEMYVILTLYIRILLYIFV